MSFRSLLGLKPGEEHRVGLMFLFSVLAVGGVVITGSVVGRSLFLSALPKSAIPLKFILPPLVMVMVAARYSGIALRYRTDRVIVTSALILALGILAFRAGLATPYGSHLALLCAMFVFFDIATNLTMIQFWTFASEIFDPREAKRLFGLISAGGTIAAILFGAGLRGLSGTVQTQDFLFLMVACLLGLAACARSLGKSHGESLEAGIEEGPQEKESVLSSLRGLAKSPLLVSLCAMVVLVALVSNITDYQMDLALQKQYGQDGQGMIGFLGGFRLWTGVAAALVQFFLAGRLFSKFGVKAALLILPLGMGLGSGAILVSGGLLAAVVLPRAMDMVFKYTINQTAFNLLYLPVKPGLRRQAKVLISGVINPAIVSLLGLSFLVVDKYTDIPLIGWSVPALVLIAVWLKTLLKASKQYVSALAQSIRRRDFNPDDEQIELMDDTTMGVMLESVQHTNPTQVIHAIDLMGRLESVDWRPHLLPLLSHSDSDVKRQALQLAGRLGGEALEKAVLECLEDPDPLVQAVAARSYCSLCREQAVEVVRPCLNSPNPEVKAAAVCGLIQHGGLDGILHAAEHLKALLVSEDAEQRLAGARVLGELEAKSFHQPLLELMDDPCPQVRIGAIRAAGQLAHRELLPGLIKKLDDTRARGACVEALGRCLGEDVPLLVPKLSSPKTQPDVKIAITKIFEAQSTQTAIQLLWGQLSLSEGAYRTAVCHALLRLRERGLELPNKVEQLVELLHQEARATYRLHTFSGGTPLLTEALELRIRQALERLLAIAALLYPQISLDCLKASLFQDNERVRAYGLELLDNVLSGDSKELLIPLFGLEPSELLKLALDTLDQEAQARASQLQELAQSADWWLRTCAFYAIRSEEQAPLKHLLEPGLTAEHPLERDTAWLCLQSFLTKKAFRAKTKELREHLTGTPYLEALAKPKGHPKMPLSNIEELIFLRSVPLFAELSGEDLAGIVPITQEVHFEKGTPFIKEGEEGDCLYVVVDGEVQVEIAGEEKSICTTPDTLGELSILSEEPRSATCVALTELVTLRLDKMDFWDLMGERPEIAKGVIKVLLRYAK